MSTFEQIDKEAAALDVMTPLGRAVNDLVAHADDNATDEAGKIASLETLLAYRDDKALHAWFAAHGVEA